MRGIVLSLCVAAAVLLALAVMLLVGYVPTDRVAPMNERVFTLLCGLGAGLLLAVAFIGLWGGDGR